MFAAGFGRHDPARGAHVGQQAEGLGVEDIQRRPGDEGEFLLGQQAHGAHLVGLDGKAAIVDQAPHGLEVGFGFDQRQRRQHDFLAGGGELRRHIELVVEAQFVAARADRLAEIDDVDRHGGHCGVEVERLLPRPVVLEGAEG